jgi:hypothetical protein
MGCGGSKTSTPAPAPGLLKEDKIQQEVKSRTLNENAASPQTAVAIVEATAPGNAKEPAEEPKTKTLAEYVDLIETASPAELDVVIAGLPNEYREKLQQAIASLKEPPVEETKAEIKVEEEPEKEIQQMDLEQVAIEADPLELVDVQPRRVVCCC